ncbi:MAG: winged helix-turn-helix transcriptional regulator [Ruminiclostridium sp.]|nr:winged helix-turn-helix transcriptional regulator [Ruminiclostridium sp.]
MVSYKELYKLHADFCKFMANPKRIEILFLLGEKEMCVDEIASQMNVRVPNISQHLAVMRERGIVEARREGTKMHYRVTNPKTLQACTIMRDAMIEQMKKKLETLTSITNIKQF